MDKCCNCGRDIAKGDKVHYNFPKVVTLLVCDPCFNDAGKNLAMVPAIRRKTTQIRG